MFKRVRKSELNDIAREWHFSLDDEEVDEFHKLTEYVVDVTETVPNLPTPAPENVAARRDPGRRPYEGEDPYNAVVRWCSVKLDGAEGLLSDTRLGFKDAIQVAGVPLTGGSSILSDFVPTTDSTVTRRVLEAGGEIVAMLNMDYLAFSGGGDSSAYGPTLCPFDTTRTAAGSSGGSGAANYYDDIDMTLGCDQGGSIRAPAAWSGVIGLKATYGLVPYTGILGIDQPIDHCGPLARTAADAARLLQVVAGPDPLDPRQRGEIPTRDYVGAVAQAPDDLRGVRIGVVTEGFSDEVGASAEVCEATRGAIERFSELGAEVKEVSIPAHVQAGGLAFTGFLEGMASLMQGGGNGFGWQGQYSPELARAMTNGLRSHADDLSHQVKLMLIYATYMRRRYGAASYALAQNLRPWLRDRYNEALGECDVLAMPTMPVTPHKVDPDLPISEHVQRGWGVLSNTVLTNITGHPAISLPAAKADDLPVGVMLLGRHFDDDALLRFARTYEASNGWLPTHSGDPRSSDSRWEPAGSVA